MGSCFTTKGAGRVLRSATRTVRKRSWAAIMLRQRLRMQSKFSVAELGANNDGAGAKIPRRLAAQRCFANPVNF